MNKKQIMRAVYEYLRRQGTIYIDTTSEMLIKAEDITEDISYYPYMYPKLYLTSNDEIIIHGTGGMIELLELKNNQIELTAFEYR